MMTAKSNLNSVEHNTRIYNLLLLYRRFASFMYKKDWYVAVGSWWIDGFFMRCLWRDSFLVVVIDKAESVAVAVQSYIVAAVAL